MKNLIKSLLVTILISQFVWAGLPPTSVKGVSDATPQTKFQFQVPFSQKTDLGGIKTLFETGNKNILVNGSFENTSYKTGWTTVVGGSAESQDLTTFTDGISAYKIVSPGGAISGFTVTQDVTPVQDFGGKTLEASCWVKNSITNLTPQLCARTAGANITASCVTLPTDAIWHQVLTNFTAATAASAGLQITVGTSPSAGTLDVDECYVGEARNFGTGTIVTDWVAYTPVFSGYGTPSAVTFFSRRVGGTLEVTGNFTSGTTTATQAQIGLGYGGIAANVTLDTSRVTAGAMIGRCGQTATGAGFFDISILAPSANQTYVNMGFQGNASSMLTAQNGNGINGSNAGFSCFFSAPIVGWTSSSPIVAQNQNLQPTTTVITTGGCTPSANCSGSTYTPPNGVSRLSVEMVGPGGGGNGSGTSASMGLGANGSAATTFGSQLSAGLGGGPGVVGSNGGPGGSASCGTIATCVSFVGGSGSGGNQNTTSTYSVSGSGASGPFGGQGGGGTSAIGGFAAAANTGSGGGGGGGGAAADVNAGAGGGAGGFVKALLNNPAASYSFVVGSGGSGGSAGTSGFAGGAGAGGVIYITEYYSYGNALILPNTITTNANAPFRTEEAQITSNGTVASPLSQSGSWITSCSVGGNVGAVSCVIAAGIFSAAPSCTPVLMSSGNNSSVRLAAHSTSTAFSTQTVTIAGSPVVQADDFEIICMGPR